MNRPTRATLSVGLFAIALATKAAANSTTTNCSCGYYDATAGVLWTESIIVYFNETTVTSIPNFVDESYSHKFEKGWDTRFRTGADISNIDVSNSTSPSKSPMSLELHVSPYKSDHLVVGSSMRTLRRDIQYGSFTSLLRSPGKSAGGGGSVLSFLVEYNSSQSISTNLHNTDMPSTAFVSTLGSQESSDTSTVQYGNMTDGGFGNGTISPWDFTEYRLDWTKDEVKFLVGGNVARSLPRSDNEDLLSVPSPLYLRHWSNGLATGSQGPPNLPTVANVGWVRLFFNSSLMAEGDHASFDSRCQTSVACSVDDMTLRGSSFYSEESTKEWEQKLTSSPKRVFATWLAVACISLTAFLLLNPIWKRIRERWSSTTEIEQTPQPLKDPINLSSSIAESVPRLDSELTPHLQIREPSTDPVTLVGIDSSSTAAKTYNPSRSSPPSPKAESSGTFRRRSIFPVDEGEPLVEFPSDPEQKAFGETMSPEMLSTSEGRNRVASVDKVTFADFRTEERKEEERRLPPTDETTKTKNLRISWNTVGWKENTSSLRPISEADPAKGLDIAALDLLEKKSDANTKVTEAFPHLPETGKRIDHLAGLVVVSCLLVTAINFNLTFLYSDIMPGGLTRYHGEVVVRKTVASFLLNPIWIGPFLLTSARFLVVSYLRTGDILAIAEKTAKRVCRLMLPVTAMVMLEYFFIDCNATKWLEYLPSVTWSTWPFIEGYSNFGNFLSEILELVYLIPNATPVITFNYCTNVLWTIPVQLQGSWTTLLAIIIIREIKTPWKRFGFYTFCIINHWYALSWGSYFYIGIMFTDLEVTYKWQTYLHARWIAYYPLLLFCVLAALAGPAVDLLTQRTEIGYTAYEYGVHPNVTSGLPISKVSHATNPQYFIPRLNGLVFALGFQATIEISPMIQKLFSLKLLMRIFPHIFTIYLLHGFIFWTLGSWLCVSLAVHDLSYWSNILIVALCCYVILALSVPLVTPVIECLGKTFTMDVWRQAREEPAPRHRTLYPFPEGLFLNRYEVSYDDTPSQDVDMDLEQQRPSREPKMISRDRRPSKDIGTPWNERKPSTDPRISWYGRKASQDVDMDLEQQRPSREPKTISRDRRPSKDIGTPWDGRKPSTDPRISWYERKASKAVRLERVEDEEG